jgi:hypothetical protein
MRRDIPLVAFRGPLDGALLLRDDKQDENGARRPSATLP